MDEADLAQRAEEQDRERALRIALNQPSRFVLQGPAGSCADCGEPIEAGRLQVLPSTPYCAECARTNEQAARLHAWKR